MSEHNFSTAFSRVRELVENFQIGEQRYLETSYSESQARIDFIDKFWIALGWDVNHEREKNPYEQEVKVERGVSVSNRLKKADYAFFAAPNFRDVKFYVEAKKPARNLDNADDYFQTIRYGWSSNTPIAVLMDFEQFRVIDCRYKPNIKTAENFWLKKFSYAEYADEEKFREIYHLFSREAVIGGSLETFAASLPKRGKGAKQGKLFATGIQKSIDESFLDDLDAYRADLARAFKNKNFDLDGEALTEAVTRTLDRLVFIRFLEDKLIEPDTMIDKFDSWTDFVKTTAKLNGVYNGIIFKPHFIDSPDFKPDEKVFTDICGELSAIDSPYYLGDIPVHILGSVYERFLGKVIVTTDKRATVQEKPEVRKAGGVYYTPEYIVRYIVENTVGKLIEKKTPAEIAAMNFADIACGSGSFLLGVYDYLLRYHTSYYNETGKKTEARAAGCLENADGSFTLTIAQRREILRNNVFGVDIDAQAVEVAQLSLALKLLEDATTATARAFQPKLGEKILPDMTKNIVCGNSLVDWDILDGQLFERNEERKLNPMSYEDKFPEIMRRGGFDAIVGNPPYVFGRDWNFLQIPVYVKNYLGNRYKSSPYQLDFFSIFMEKAMEVCSSDGYIGQIVPNVWLTNTYSWTTRKFIISNTNNLIITAPPNNVFEGITVDTTIYTGQKTKVFGDSFEIKKMFNEQSLLVATYKTQDYIDGQRPVSASLTAESADLIYKLHSFPLKLKDFAEITRGIHPYRLGGYGQTAFGAGNQIQRDIDERPYHSKTKLEDYRGFIYGKDLKRFSTPIPNEFVKYGNWLAEPRRPEFFEGERVYSRKILGERLVVTLEKNDTVADQQVYITKPFRDFPSAGFLAGILGSKLIAFFVRGFYDEVNDAFPQIKVGQLQSLPIPNIESNNISDKGMHDRMVSLVEQMIEAKKNLQAARTDRDKDFYDDRCKSLDRQIDRLVYDLYALSADEIKIVEGQ